MGGADASSMRSPKRRSSQDGDFDAGGTSGHKPPFDTSASLTNQKAAADRGPSRDEVPFNALNRMPLAAVDGFRSCRVVNLPCGSFEEAARPQGCNEESAKKS